MSPPTVTPTTDAELLVPAAKQWLAEVEQAFVTNDAEAFGNSFLPHGWLRDMLCFSWDFASVGPGAAKIAEHLSLPPSSPSAGATDLKTRIEYAGLHSFALDHKSTLPSPRRTHIPGVNAMEGAFTFSLGNPKGTGRGYFRLFQVPSPDGGLKWKAASVLLSLWDLAGHEESFERTDGHISDLSGRGLWDDVEEEKKAAVESDPTVLIVGAGQSGLIVAARMQHMGLRVLCLEKSPRVGDVWRNRYDNLTLHTSTHSNSLLYETLPRTAPQFLPRTKVANYLEAYAISQDLHVWTSSTLEAQPTYDADSKRWNATVIRTDASGNETKVVLRPKHLVMAIGNGAPRLPDIKGLKEAAFKGKWCHSSQHRDSKEFRGKKVVVVGAGNSAGDICQDAHAHGADVTMVQRGPTCVFSMEAHETIVMPDFTEDNGIPRYAIEDIDITLHSMAPPLFMQISEQVLTPRYKAIDKEMHENLEKTGFKLTWSRYPGGPEIGPLGLLTENLASGTILDVGIIPMIIDGRVKVKSGYGVREMIEDGLIFEDGTKLEADIVIFATGYRSIKETVEPFFPPSVSVPKKIWGLAEDGEIAGVYRKISQPGLWFVAGGFGHVRFLSKHLALQVIAQEVGLNPV